MPIPSARNLLRMALPVLAAAALAGCASTSSGTGSTSMLGGFAAGDNGGNRASQSIAAAMGGGLIGPALGGSLDERDRRRAVEAEYRALEYGQVGQAVPWQGSGAVAGEVVAFQPYRVGSQDCRQYAHTVQIGGQSRSVRGAACRNGDGSWTPLV